MNFIAWILMGLIAGAIAKSIMKERGGWISTLLTGLIGGVVGGWIGSAVFNVGLEGFFNLQTWIIAILGSLLVLVIWGFITKNRRA